MNSRNKTSFHPDPTTSWEANWKREQIIRREEHIQYIEDRYRAAAKELGSGKDSYRWSEMLESLYGKICLISQVHEEEDLDVLFFGASKLLELYFSHPEKTEPYQVSGMMDYLRICAENTNDATKRLERMKLYAHYVEEIGHAKIPYLKIWSTMAETKERMLAVLSSSLHE